MATTPLCADHCIGREKVGPAPAPRAAVIGSRDGASRVERPYTLGYGVRGAGYDSWLWAQERPASSHDYWVVSVWPDDRPHTPVWGM